MDYVLVRIQDGTEVGHGMILASECATLEEGDSVTIIQHGSSSDQQLQYQIVDDSSGLQYLAERGTGEGGHEGTYEYMVRPLHPWSDETSNTR
ncbi:hypothetical protein ACFP9V_25190 [Deinococcus radiopugnans]|uniref:Uncharacterized protein n=1 Tax=Deinococcus radiopugnans ATCC 19172 TaxID=585398 RepID=A0A5C4XGC8_9DEIO|nr:hypothetical protein [Deinococcus radiopugnans]MBB6018867.1 hypothetical protein [Deinococcus radiopugnans ATCC 19172]TNM62487.1 hypothetical protein FHR04_20315 [Deinococcus radiopugnans ATCC 19172]